MLPKPVLRLKDVIFCTGLSKSTIYSWMDAGTFPLAIELGPNSVGWRATDIQHWINSRPDVRPK
ncbi:helix-turn-helix transcriptional regulator [Hydrocarboniphaga effusa]|jgi:prophage regulatory protein|uniref:helix-turn-helix transcriptional regulator n=1 Tax=Hydrocarboniphaga effusa TaxID=243629 RepID=UPI00398BD828